MFNKPWHQRQWLGSRNGHVTCHPGNVRCLTQPMLALQNRRSLDGHSCHLRCFRFDLWAAQTNSPSPVIHDLLGHQFTSRHLRASARCLVFFLQTKRFGSPQSWKNPRKTGQVNQLFLIKCSLYFSSQLLWSLCLPAFLSKS